MNAEIVFRDITRTPELENYLREQTEEVVSDFFEMDQEPHMKVTVYEDRHRSQSKHNHYVCDVLLTLPGQHQTFKVSKSSFDLYECVNEAGTALRKKVRRNHRYLLAQRRQKQNVVTEQQVEEQITESDTFAA